MKKRTKSKDECAQILFDLINENLKEDANIVMPGEVAYYIQLIDDEGGLREAIFVNTVGGQKSVEFSDKKIDDFTQKDLIFGTGGCVSMNHSSTTKLIEGEIDPVTVFEIADFQVDQRSRLEDMFYLVRMLG